MTDVESLLLAARGGDLAAYGRLVERTQSMVYAVCRQVLRRDADALDATQETFVRAFGRLADVRDPGAWPGWVRRVAVTTARTLARRQRFAFARPIDGADVPVLDEAETRWSDGRRLALSRALLTLSDDDRRTCDRFYHGGWTAARLAADAGVAEPALRKRLQRIRDRLRLEIEMSERRPETLPADLSQQVVDLLARPNLIDLPDNPVGRMTEMLLARYPGYRLIDVPEVIDSAAALRLIDADADYLPADAIHAVGPGRVLRYDMTLPLLTAAAGIGPATRVASAGPVYRNETPGPTRDQAFHQLELLAVEDRSAVDPWVVMGRTLHVVSDLLPGRTVTIEEVKYPACTRAWEVAVHVDGKPVCVLAWGLYTPHVVRHLGGDPDRHAAVGVGFGLERMAAIHFDYDDIRMLSAGRV